MLVKKPSPATTPIGLLFSSKGMLMQARSRHTALQGRKRYIDGRLRICVTHCMRGVGRRLAVGGKLDGRAARRTGAIPAPAALAADRVHA